ncbi:nucleotidyltransferase family protein [Exiguobacterium undae]
MINWKSILINPETTIMKTMEIINESTRQFAVVTDSQNKILGTVTDGDIRRGLLKGVSLEEPIQVVMNVLPVCEQEGFSLSYYKNFMKRLNLKQLPITNKDGEIQRIVFLDDIKKVKIKKNTVVIMVGGLGTRLRPLTNDIPKPMLKIGNKPILEIIIENFKKVGFVNFILSVNYKKELIKEYFSDGAYLNISISYIEETKRLGTAGALSLLPKDITEPFFVMNGDLLTKINFEKILNFHDEKKSLATMCVREYEHVIPFGVIKENNNKLISIEEKPISKNFVNAGIYVLDPKLLKYVPQNEFYDMPDLFRKLIDIENQIFTFKLNEYWLDMGCIADYEKANDDFVEDFYD